MRRRLEPLPPPPAEMTSLDKLYALQAERDQLRKLEEPGALKRRLDEITAAINRLRDDGAEKSAD